MNKKMLAIYVVLVLVIVCAAVTFLVSGAKKPEVSGGAAEVSAESTQDEAEIEVIAGSAQDESGIEVIAESAQDEAGIEPNTASAQDEAGIEVIAKCADREEALAIAEAYGIELIDYRGSYALFRSDKNMRQLDELQAEKGLPKLARNDKRKAF